MYAYVCMHVCILLGASVKNIVSPKLNMTYNSGVLQRILCSLAVTANHVFLFNHLFTPPFPSSVTVPTWSAPQVMTIKFPEEETMCVWHFSTPCRKSQFRQHGSYLWENRLQESEEEENDAQEIWYRHQKLISRNLEKKSNT